MEDIFRHIDDHLDESVAQLMELCKLPSVSAQNTAIEQTAEHVAGLLRDLGFESRLLPKPPGGHPVVYAEQPGRTPVTEPFVAMVREAVRGTHGREPTIVPSMAGTGPLYPFVATLGLPTADIGIGYPESRIRAPDENIRIEDFQRGAKAIAALLGRFGEG